MNYTWPLTTDRGIGFLKYWSFAINYVMPWGNIIFMRPYQVTNQLHFTINIQQNTEQSYLKDTHDLFSIASCN